MQPNPLDDVLDRIAKATVTEKMFNGPGEANTAMKEVYRPEVVEAIALKSLDQNHDTSGLFTEIAKEIPTVGEGTGRKIDPAEFDNIVSEAVRAFKEEQLLGSPARSKGRPR